MEIIGSEARERLKIGRYYTSIVFKRPNRSDTDRSTIQHKFVCKIVTNKKERKYMKKLIAVALFLFAVPAHATLVQILFSGLDMTGEILYEDSTPGVHGTYASRYNNAITKFSVNFKGKGYGFENNPNNSITVWNNDVTALDFRDGVQILGGSPDEYFILNLFTGPDAIDNTSIKYGFLPSVDSFPWRELEVYSPNILPGGIEYDEDRILSLTQNVAPSPVPEPMTLASLGVGLVGLVLRRKFRN